MSGSVEITPLQTIRLNLLSIVGYDTAAAAQAIEFVSDDPLRYTIFQQQFVLVTTESDPVAKTLKAIQESEEALTLFSTPGK